MKCNLERRRQRGMAFLLSTTSLLFDVLIQYCISTFAIQYCIATQVIPSRVLYGDARDSYSDSVYHPMILTRAPVVISELLKSRPLVVDVPEEARVEEQWE